MRFIDTHTHNSDEAYGQECDQVIARAVAAGVDTLLQPDIDSRERKAMFDLVRRHPGTLYPMLGLYPGSVREDWRDEIDRMLAWRDEGIVALGEIGLDYHYNADFAPQQREAFRTQLELAAEMHLPVNIHLREATEDFWKIMDDCAHLHLKGNIHAFGGSIETFRRLQRYGDWRVGIGGIVTFKKASLAQTVKDIPLDRIVLETDCPYMAPVPYRGQRNESSLVPIIAAKIAEIKGTDVAEVAEVTTAAACELFNIR